jgi:Domain of unknown function (DUF4190)
MSEGFPPPPPGSPPPGYGPPPQPYYAPQPYGAVIPPSNGAGTAGGVLGIIAIVLALVPFIDFVAVVLGVLAIIFGFVGIGRANRDPRLGKGMAITGLVCGIIAVAISVIFLLLVYGTLIGLHNVVTTTP